jgi:hypothetical protein
MSLEKLATTAPLSSATTLDEEEFDLVEQRAKLFDVALAGDGEFLVAMLREGGTAFVEQLFHHGEQRLIASLLFDFGLQEQIQYLQHRSIVVDSLSI